MKSTAAVTGWDRLKHHSLESLLRFQEISWVNTDTIVNDFRSVTSTPLWQTAKQKQNTYLQVRLQRSTIVYHYSAWKYSTLRRFKQVAHSIFAVQVCQRSLEQKIPACFAVTKHDCQKQDGKRRHVLHGLNERSTLQLGSTIGTSFSTLGLRVMTPLGAPVLQKQACRLQPAHTDPGGMCRVSLSASAKQWVSCESDSGTLIRATCQLIMGIVGHMLRKFLTQMSRKSLRRSYSEVEEAILSFEITFKVFRSDNDKWNAVVILLSSNATANALYAQYTMHASIATSMLPVDHATSSPIFDYSGVTWLCPL